MGLTVSIKGGLVRLNGVSEVVQADVEASNGVVHVIDAVLVPPSLEALVEALTEPADDDYSTGGGEEEPAKQSKNIVQLAVDTPSLSTLVSAVKAASLVDALSGTGPFTVFAPTNKAFEKVPTKVLSALLEPANKAKLQELLKYHVAAGDVKSGMLKDGQKVSTLEGSELTVSIKDGIVRLNGVTEVVQADVVASNGVVHVIDAVLVPPGLEALVASLADPTDQSKNIVQLAVGTPS